MKRYLWKKSLGKNHCPPWPCPACSTRAGREPGIVQLVKDSLAFHETVASLAEHPEEGWTPEVIEYAFTAWGKCSSSQCNQMFAIIGTGGQEQYDHSGWMQTGDDEGEFIADTGWEEYFTPLSCYPMPSMIQIPSTCPDLVRKTLQSAFALYWCDRAACLGRLRTVVERLLDHLGITKTRKSQKGNDVRLDLSERINELPTPQWSELKEALHALRYFGNTGAHEISVSQDDLLDALEVIEHWLIQILDTPDLRPKQLVQKLAQKYKKK